MAWMECINRTKTNSVHFLCVKNAFVHIVFASGSDYVSLNCTLSSSECNVYTLLSSYFELPKVSELGGTHRYSTEQL